MNVDNLPVFFIKSQRGSSCFTCIYAEKGNIATSSTLLYATKITCIWNSLPDDTKNSPFLESCKL